MKTIVDSAQMKAVEEVTIDKIGIPAIVLMERAALSVADIVKKHSNKQSKILAVCGTGNNGADGIAAARILKLKGYTADILLAGDEDKASALTRQQLNIVRNLGISIYNNIVISEYTIIIDAMFGIGLSRNISGIYKDIIEEINTGEHLVFAVDIPSGLSADTAKPMDISIKADYTITFGLNKIGLILYPGCEYAGTVIVADIGLPQTAIDAVTSQYFIYDTSDLEKLPKRKNYSNKGTYGKVLIIAGSVNMSGACYFSAKAAYRMGSGLVKVMTPAENRIIIQSQIPEALIYTYDVGTIDNNEIDKILKEIEWANVIVIGPGIGVSDVSRQLLELVLKKDKTPIIIDADGINLLAQKVNELENKSDTEFNRIEAVASFLPQHTVLTPHLKELSVLLNMTIENITSNLLETANYCTFKNNLLFVLKDARTIVANDDKRYINISGNNGMATGGTGDVLTGIIAALIAQGLDTGEAAKLGVYIHGLAGDKACETKGSYSLMASDIIDALPLTIKHNQDGIYSL
ncbi:MAG: NAD(P)H-hydrate dehydratase [Anaerocolumna sp.]